MKFLHSFSQLLQQASSTTSSFNTIIDYNFDVVKDCDIGIIEGKDTPKCVIIPEQQSHIMQRHLSNTKCKDTREYTKTFK